MRGTKRDDQDFGQFIKRNVSRRHAGTLACLLLVTSLSIVFLWATKKRAAEDTISDRVKKIVVEHLGVAPAKVTATANFRTDLGASSLDTVELQMAFEEEFGLEIPNEDAERFLTVGDAIRYLEQRDKIRDLERRSRK